MNVPVKNKMKAALDKVQTYRLRHTLTGSTGIELRRVNMVKISPKVWTSSRGSNTPLTTRYNWDVFLMLGVDVWAKLRHSGAQQQSIGGRGRLGCC